MVKRTASGWLLAGHLGDRRPESRLIPELGRPERATFYRWVIFMAVNNYATIARVNHLERYTTEKAGIDRVRAAAAREVDRQFKVLNDALYPGPYFLGSHYSALDIYLCMIASFHLEPERMYAENLRVRALCERVFKRPAIAKVWAEHHLAV